MSEYRRVPFNKKNFNNLKAGDQIIDGDGDRRTVISVYDFLKGRKTSIKIRTKSAVKKHEYRYLRYKMLKDSCQGIRKKKIV